MKLIAELNNEKHEVEFKRDGERISATIDGREYALEASEVEPNVYLLKHENRVFQLYVAPSETPIVTLGNHSFEIKISDPKRLRGAGGAGGSADGTIEIKTAMPGKVVRVIAEQGAEIKQGESVLVVEAMKMQNEMKSPKDGIVKEIRVAEGATVNAGDVLAIIE
ncbi:MAG: biotin/lipoyl-binding protein [Acidobacteriota bacterium]|nr:biotin/lipoyl-binding protein [Acidobacteriota bacterium]